MKYIVITILTLFVFLMNGCSSPEDKLVGMWEFDSYEIDKSGIGAAASFIPEGWKETMDEYILNISNYSKGTYYFKDNGTFETSFSGLEEGLTKKAGNYSLSPDYTTLTLKTGNAEKAVRLKEITADNFVEVWEFDDYGLPFKINLKYRRVLMH